MIPGPGHPPIENPHGHASLAGLGIGLLLLLLSAVILVTESPAGTAFVVVIGAAMLPVVAGVLYAMRLGTSAPKPPAAVDTVPSGDLQQVERALDRHLRITSGGFLGLGASMVAFAIAFRLNALSNPIAGLLFGCGAVALTVWYVFFVWSYYHYCNVWWREQLKAPGQPEMLPLHLLRASDAGIGQADVNLTLGVRVGTLKLSRASFQICPGGIRIRSADADVGGPQWEFRYEAVVGAERVWLMGLRYGPYPYIRVVTNAPSLAFLMGTTSMDLVLLRLKQHGVLTAERVDA
jgi:hypothetical protein